MDAAEESNDADLEREVVELRQENLNLRNRVEQLEIERDEMRSALQPVLCMLGISSSSGKRTHRNGGGSNADHLGGYINGSGSASLQNLTMNSNRAASKQDQNQTRQVGW